ncbi:amastin-like surface protein, putative [Leishmania donovani]|uniref:Amastin-like surface protein, putative n=1 Tax=Leishmania donovani TaxID=5661 RepID=E9BQW9_LEIDO|nr:amastin-like surface protein, putative [Leishmania donovani]CBZ37648.1 amastin-like surface protein, putative [Leishmania donovani]
MSGLPFPSLRCLPAVPLDYKRTLILYVVLQFVAFILLLVGTPLDIFRSNPAGMSKTLICITLWGFKNDCSSLHSDLTLDDIFHYCPDRLRRFRALQIFVIVSIVVYGAAFIAGFTLLFCFAVLRLTCMALNIVGSVILCVAIVIVAATFSKDDGQNCRRLSSIGYRLGASFFLFVVAWILDIINMIILLLPYTDTESAVDKKAEPPTAQE